MFGSKKFQAKVKAALTVHHAALWRYALALTGDRDAADDLVQSTCLRAMEKAHTLRHDDGLRAWIFTMCRSIWLNQNRASALRRADMLDEGAVVDPTSLMRSAEANIFTAQVLKEVMALPAAQRETVMLVYVLGYRYREAAMHMNVPVGTVMSRLSAARARIAKWADEGGDVIELARRRATKKT